MGLVGAAFSLGFIVGFPIGGVLSSARGNLPESQPKEVRQAASRRHPRPFSAALAPPNFTTA